MSHQSTATHKLKVKAVDAVLQSAKPNISGLDGFVSMGPPSNGFCWVNFAGEDAAKKAQAAINGPSFFSSQLNAMEPQALPVQPPRGPVQTFRPAVPGPALPAHAVPTPAVHPSPAAGGGHSSVADVTISVSDLKFSTSAVPAELSDKIVQPVPGPHQVKVQGFADHHTSKDIEAALKDLYERRASKKLAGFKQTSSCLGMPPKMYCYFTFDSFDQLQDCKMQCENAQLLSAGSLQWKEIRKFEPPQSRSAEVSPSTSPVSSRSPSPAPASFRLPARSGGARLRLGPDGLPEEHLTNLALMKNCMVRFLPEELKSSLPDIKVIASKKQAELIFDQNFGLAQEIYESFIGMPVFTAMTDGTNIKIDLLPLSSDDVLRSSSEEVRAAAVESEAQLQSLESKLKQGAVLPNPSTPPVSLAGVETIFRMQISGSGKPAKTVTIRLIDADITQWQGDVIVNAANESLLGGGGVDGAIHIAAGPGLLAACRRVVPDKSNGHRCKVGEAKLTQGPFDGSRLGASHVIHTVGPRGSAQNRAVLLSSAYTSALDLVIQNNYSSVAFPSISTGIFQYPKDEAAATAAKAITSFLQKHQDIQYLSKIDLCILDPSNVLLWSQALKSVLSGPVVPPPPVDEALKKHMGVLLYRMRKGSASDQVCMEVLLGHVGNQLVPISAQPLEKDDGGTGENRAQMLALEALRNGTGDLMSSQGLAHVGATISGQPPLVCGSHHLWFVHSVDNNSLAQDAAQISSSYALLRKRSDRVVSVAALQWISIETFTKQDSASFPKIQPQLLRNTQPHAKQLSGIHAVLKNPALTAKLQELFQIGSQRIAAEESSQKDTLLKKLEADIAAAGAELPVLAQHVEQLSIESDPVPPVESLPECHDIVTLAEPPTGVKLTSGSKQPVRIRKVNIPEREQRFDAYLASRASGFRSSARSFHGTPTLAAAASIARTGPDLSRAGKNIGKAYGAGFYTDTDPAYPEGVAGSGSVLVCTVAPGKSCSQGNSSTTAATLSMQGFDSVAPRGWHVLFHPDAVRVDYIVDYSFQGDEAAEKRLAQEKAHELAKQQRETQEMSRKAKLASKQARQKMVQTFVARCEELKQKVRTDEGSLPVVERLEFIEKTQFYDKKGEGLPMYARKWDIVDMIRTQGCCIVKGGTGTGKTVCVPQWTYDHVFYELGKPGKKVAILVPRRAIAEGLAGYISRTRHVLLGEEVGLGVSGNVQLSDKTRLFFATYGCFRAMTSGQEHFKEWDAVLLDEAHERNIDADALFPQLALASKARPVGTPNEFRAVIMSATIDVQRFASTLAESLRQAPQDPLPDVPSISVEGVTYPVADIYSDKNWDPQASGAIVNLCVFVMHVFRKETGNVLVFLPTIAAVDEAVGQVQNEMRHDVNCVVKPLYAALDTWEKNEVEFFTDLKQYPDNEGKRLICFSTNVAEAGITIPGISAVIETGCEISVVYDPVLRMSTIACEPISRASQVQRRGRAGRTAPGSCYCTYTKDFLDKMSEYAVPSIEKQDLQGFYLGLVNAGLDPLANPATSGLLDTPLDRLQAARDELLQKGIIRASAAAGFHETTDPGKLVSRIPLEISYAVGLLVAVQKYNCGNDFAILSSVGMSAARAGLFLKQATADQKNSLAHPSGDHLTFVNVYKEWSKEKSIEWSEANGVRHDVLQSADELLTKVRRACAGSHNQDPIPLQDTPEGEDRTEGLLRALIHSFVNNAAHANDPNVTKSGFTLVSNFANDPVTDASIMKSTCLPEKSFKLKVTGFTRTYSPQQIETAFSEFKPPFKVVRAETVTSSDGEFYCWLAFADKPTLDAAAHRLSKSESPDGVPFLQHSFLNAAPDASMNTVLFSSYGRTEKGGKVKNSISFVSLLPDGMLEAEAALVFKDAGDQLKDFKAMMEMTKRIKHVTPLTEGLAQKETCDVIHKSIKQVQHEFPLASVRFVCDNSSPETLKKSEVRILAPEICFDSVKKRVDEALSSATPAKVMLKTSTEDAQKWFNVETGKLSEAGQSELDQLKQKLGVDLKISYDPAKLCVNVQTLKSISDHVSKHLQRVFPAPPAPPKATFKLKVSGFTQAHSSQEIQTAVASALSALAPPVKIISAGPVAPPALYSWLNFADQPAAAAAAQHLSQVALLSAAVLRPAPTGPQPISSQSDSGSASGGSSPETSPGPPISRGACLFGDKATRLKLLHSDPPDPSLMQSPGSQHEKEVFMLRLANYIVTKTGMFIYGGYIRDYILRGDLHDEVDLDVALPLGRGQTPQDGLKTIRSWSAQNGLTYMRQNPKGPLTLEVFFGTPSGFTFPVEVVDSEGWAQTAGVKLDFDVNNLKALQNHKDDIVLKRPEQGPGKAAVLDHVDKKTLVVLKPVNEVAARIAKMKQRGWQVLFPE